VLMGWIVLTESRSAWR